MATITVIVSAAFRKYVRDYNPYTGKELEFDPPATVGDIVEILGIPMKDVHIIMVNNSHATMETVLADKARLALFPPVGGG